MAAAAVRRFSRDPRIRRRQELFDDLQYRAGIDYFAPSMAELAAASVTKATPICRDYACRHEGGPSTCRACRRKCGPTRCARSSFAGDVASAVPSSN